MMVLAVVVGASLHTAIFYLKTAMYREPDHMTLSEEARLEWLSWSRPVQTWLSGTTEARWSRKDPPKLLADAAAWWIC